MLIGVVVAVALAALVGYATVTVPQSHIGKM
jgi:hypothetical protein